MHFSAPRTFMRLLEVVRGAGRQGRDRTVMRLSRGFRSGGGPGPPTAYRQPHVDAPAACYYLMDRAASPQKVDTLWRSSAWRWVSPRGDMAATTSGSEKRRYVGNTGGVFEDRRPPVRLAASARRRRRGHRHNPASASRSPIRWSRHQRELTARSSASRRQDLRRQIVERECRARQRGALIPGADRAARLDIDSDLPHARFPAHRGGPCSPDTAGLANVVKRWRNSRANPQATRVRGAGTLLARLAPRKTFN